MEQWAKLPLETPASISGGLGLSPTSTFELPAVLSGKQQIITQVLEFLPPTWKTWMEFPGFWLQAGPALAITGIWMVN